MRTEFLNHILPKEDENFTGNTLNICHVCEECRTCDGFVLDLLVRKFREFKNHHTFSNGCSWIRIKVPIQEENVILLDFNGIQNLLNLTTSGLHQSNKNLLSNTDSFLLVSPMVDRRGFGQPYLFIYMIIRPILKVPVMDELERWIQELNRRYNSLTLEFHSSMLDFNEKNYNDEDIVPTEEYCDFLQLSQGQVTQPLSVELESLIRWGGYFLDFDGEQYNSVLFDLNKQG